MQTHWDRWGWIVPVVIIAVGFLRVVWGRDVFCGDQSEQCFREWVSALGGWVAVVIAVPSLMFLSKQIRDTDRHHRRSAALTLRRLRSLALNVHGSSKNASALAYSWMVIFSGARANGVVLFRKREELIRLLDEATILLRDKNFEAFEAEVYLPMNHAIFLCEQLAKIRKDVEGQPEWLNGTIAVDIAKQLHEAHGLIKAYMDDVCVNAERFLVDTSEYASLRD